MNMRVLLYFLISLSCILGIKIFKLSPEISFKDSNSTVEILDSDLKDYEQFTICGRFKTPYLSSMTNMWQNLLWMKGLWVIGMLEAKSNDTALLLKSNLNVEFYRESMGK